jgi:hypothetical protein
MLEDPRDAKADEPLHLRAKSSRPGNPEYWRCEVCGVMIGPKQHGIVTPLWTDDPSVYWHAKNACHS